MTDELSAEVREAYRRAKGGPAVKDGYILADAIVHERAMRMRAEWMQHEPSCLGECGDNRHAWTDADWERFVEGELSR